MKQKQEWDISLSNATTGQLVMRFPMALSRSLKERGLNRAVVTLTDEGILLRPYAGPVTVTEHSHVDIPDTWK